MLERLLIALIVLATAAAAWSLVWLTWRLRKQRLIAALNHQEGKEPPRDGPPTGAGRILYFTTDYCVQCRALQEPALERLKASWPGALVIEKVDPLQRPDLAREYRVVTVPTTAVFDAGGTLREINYGYAPVEKLAAQLGGEPQGVSSYQI